MIFKGKKILGIMCAGVLAFPAISALFAGCSGGTVEERDPDASPALKADGSYDLDLSVYDWTLQEKVARFSNSVECYYIKNVVYCANPTSPSLQCLNIYVPTAYLNEDGTINKSGTVNGYTAETAPIIYQNSCGSYYGYAPYTILSGKDNGCSFGWYFDYVNAGYVVIFAGERGINTVDENMTILGAAPVGLADLKAGIRYIRHNKDLIPGDTDKIISQGMSAGGAMSSLLGTSGNTHYFDSYLEAMGAIMDESDAVFADQAYCPIIDLDHAALAYEWTYRADKEGQLGAVADSYTEFTTALSDLMAPAYAQYVNGLGLKDKDGNALTLNEDGTQGGTLYDWLISQYEKSYEEYLNDHNGSKLAHNDYDWLTYDADEKKATLVETEEGTALESLIKSDYLYRKKNCLSFDDLEKSGDNRVFGVPGSRDATDESKRHFTTDLPDLIKQLEDEYPEEAAVYYEAYNNDVTNPEVIEMIKWYSPYQYIKDGATDIAPHFRINVGSEDSDTSPLVSGIFAILLANAGIDVEYNLEWGFGHIDADYPEDFIDWVDSICK